MKKIGKKGFMLTETLIVSTMLVTVLLILYVQFKNVTRSFYASFTYNTVGSSYNLYNAKLYIEQSNYSLIVEKLKTNDYVDLTECPGTYFTNTDYCETLFTKLGITKIIMTNENLYSLINDNDFDSDFNDFLNSIDYETTDGYRLIGTFKDGTYASIRILNGDEFNFVISNACAATKEVAYKISHIVIPESSATEGFNLAEDTIGKLACGSNISVTSYAITSNSCYYVSKVSPSNSMDLGIDEDANTATIYYGKYASNLTINHYKYGTTQVLADSTIVSSYCGNKILVEQYKKNIAGYNYDSAQQETVTMTSTDSTVNLYYKEV